jgi:hypothetical protein
MLRGNRDHYPATVGDCSSPQAHQSPFMRTLLARMFALLVCFLLSSACKPTKIIRSDPIKTSVKIFTSSPGAKVKLALQISNDSSGTIKITLEYGFPSGRLNFVDDEGNHCPLTKFGSLYFNSGIGGRGSEVTLQPGSKQEWEMPLDDYFVFPPGHWTLKGRVNLLASEERDLKYVELNLPEVSFTVAPK